MAFQTPTTNIFWLTLYCRIRILTHNYGSFWPKTYGTHKSGSSIYRYMHCALTHFSQYGWRWTGCVPVGEYFGDELVKVWIWSEGAFRHQLLATRGALCQPEKHQTYIKCCGSGMFIPDPDFLPSRFPDPTTTRTKKRGKFFLYYFLLRHKFHKTEDCFIFEKVQNTLDFEILNISDLCDSRHHCHQCKCFRSGLDPDSIGSPDTDSGRPKSYSKKGNHK